MEGFLLKHTSFQRWRRRYFCLEGHRLYYSKEPKVSTHPVCIVNIVLS